jgi:hypothetical protein
MLAAGYYDEADTLLWDIIMQRAMDTANLQEAQRMRVVDRIGHAKVQTLREAREGYFGQALKEGKGYYNVAALSATADAANLLADALAQTADTAMATEFLQEQAVDPPAQSSAVFKSIQGNTTLWDTQLKDLQSRVRPSGASYINLMSQGEYYLLDDRAEDARRCFEGACRAAGSRAKQLRDAVEGVARAIRAQDGNVARANGFIDSLRKGSADAAAALMDGAQDSSKLSDLESAAKAIKLADMSGLEKTPG